MINIFANETIYGSAYEQVGTDRPFNSSELSHLNIEKPGEVFQGKFGLSCRLFIKGSTTSYFCKGLDRRSTLVEGQFFDVTKVKISQWRKQGLSDTIDKVYITDDAIV